MNRFTEALILATAYAMAAHADDAHLRTFPSAEAAAEALFAAVQSQDEKALSQIVGGDPDLLSSGDKSSDEIDRKTFLAKYSEMHRLAREPDATVLYIGAENWPFPVPIVSTKGTWSFDPQTGKREVLFRRIGANESFAIDVCRALARSEQEAPAAFVGSKAPFHGYYFRALPAGQGKAASFVAYPAEYRSSGVMTFLVGGDGVVYERDLGSESAKAASTLKGKKPDSSWQAVN
jgi:hypothetical protein